MIHYVKLGTRLYLGINIVTDDENAILNVKFLFKHKEQIYYFRFRIRKLKVFLACKKKVFRNLFLFNFKKKAFSQEWFNYI